MMHPRKWFIITALAASIWTPAVGASEFQEKRFYITPFGGWTFFDNERKFQDGATVTDDAYFGGRAGVRLTDLLWFELAGGYTDTQDCLNCTESWAHGSGNIVLSPASLRTINPFLSLGGGFSRYWPAHRAVEESGTFEAAGGVRVRLNDSFGVRLEARNVLALPKSNWGKAHIDDIVVGAGLTYAFGAVSKSGDSDGDGVADHLDKCPGTPKGCTVDANGCPSDSDGDGVCDGNDQCPGTPSGARVDANGCPSDADGDGVYDGIDQCPDTPRGCTVDARGCPSDSDGDGVCDGRDKCPGTPAGTKVDADGCPLQDRETKLEMELLNTGLIRLTDVQFDYDKSTIRNSSHAVLDTVGRVLTKWPGLRFEVDGHTDSRGTEAYNHDLSHRRAQAVRDYLLSHFSQLEQGQVTAKGFGEGTPLVPNTSPENMQQNRRVEFVVLNKEVLRQPR